jgi:hypothetical protein
MAAYTAHELPAAKPCTLYIIVAKLGGLAFGFQNDRSFIINIRIA